METLRSKHGHLKYIYKNRSDEQSSSRFILRSRSIHISRTTSCLSARSFTIYLLHYSDFINLNKHRRRNSHDLNIKLTNRWWSVIAPAGIIVNRIQNGWRGLLTLQFTAGFNAFKSARTVWFAYNTRNYSSLPDSYKIDKNEYEIECVTFPGSIHFIWKSFQLAMQLRCLVLLKTVRIGYRSTKLRLPHRSDHIWPYHKTWIPYKSKISSRKWWRMAGEWHTMLENREYGKWWPLHIHYDAWLGLLGCVFLCYIHISFRPLLDSIFSAHTSMYLCNVLRTTNARTSWHNFNWRKKRKKECR